MGAMSSRSRNLPSVSLALHDNHVMVIVIPAPVEQTGRSNSDLPSFFHLLIDCLGYVLVIFFVNIGVVQFNSFKWKLDLVFEVIVHTKWNLWLLFPFPHIVSFFRGSQRGIFEVCPGHAFQYNEREWGMDRSSSKRDRRIQKNVTCVLYSKYSEAIR